MRVAPRSAYSTEIMTGSLLECTFCGRWEWELDKAASDPNFLLTHASSLHGGCAAVEGNYGGVPLFR